MPKFFSPQVNDLKLDHERLGSSSYRYYNFAILQTQGLSFVFDMMRYDRAFFVRKSDVEKIIEHVLERQSLYSPYAHNLLLGCFDWQSRNKASWTPQRLLSTQRYEFINDAKSLQELESDLLDFNIKPPAKFCSTIEFKGTLADALRVMYLNRAMPQRESDSGKLEWAAHQPEEPITVCLKTFSAVEKEWRMPS